MTFGRGPGEIREVPAIPTTTTTTRVSCVNNADVVRPRSSFPTTPPPWRACAAGGGGASAPARDEAWRGSGHARPRARKGRVWMAAWLDTGRRSGSPNLFLPPLPTATAATATTFLFSTLFLPPLPRLRLASLRFASESSLLLR
uniref:Uncharacterized protein n=1 Tax=Oryza glumipatula TaxID=40148 RepID=A0A0D9Y6X9_9ORYZ